MTVVIASTETITDTFTIFNTLCEGSVSIASSMSTYSSDGSKSSLTSADVPHISSSFEETSDGLSTEVVLSTITSTYFTSTSSSGASSFENTSEGSSTVMVSSTVPSTYFTSALSSDASSSHNSEVFNSVDAESKIRSSITSAEHTVFTSETGETGETGSGIISTISSIPSSDNYNSIELTSNSYAPSTGISLVSSQQESIIASHTITSQNSGIEEHSSIMPEVHSKVSLTTTVDSNFHNNNSNLQDNIISDSNYDGYIRTSVSKSSETEQAYSTSTGASGNSNSLENTLGLGQGQNNGEYSSGLGKDRNTMYPSYDQTRYTVSSTSTTTSNNEIDGTTSTATISSMNQNANSNTATDLDDNNKEDSSSLGSRYDTVYEENLVSASKLSSYIYLSSSGTKETSSFVEYMTRATVITDNLLNKNKETAVVGGKNDMNGFAIVGSASIWPRKTGDSNTINSLYQTISADLRKLSSLNTVASSRTLSTAVDIQTNDVDKDSGVGLTFSNSGISTHLNTWMGMLPLLFLIISLF